MLDEMLPVLDLVCAKVRQRADGIIWALIVLFFTEVCRSLISVQIRGDGRGDRFREEWLPNGSFNETSAAIEQLRYSGEFDGVTCQVAADR